MKGFKLYFYDNNEAILFSQYLKNKTNSTTTFDESLQKELNDKYILNFSMYKNTFDEEINFTKVLKIGRKIRLEYEEFEGDNYIDLVITSFSPESTEDNIKYNYTCQDLVSFKFSKNNIGLNLSTIEDEE
ncbi:MAG: hypothetical protein ACOC1K_06320 [Nanoarchaeota archaeon]